MKNVLIVGMGRIGRAIACLSRGHNRIIHDAQPEIQNKVFNELLQNEGVKSFGPSMMTSQLVMVPNKLQQFLSDQQDNNKSKIDAIISAVPHHATSWLADLAIKHNINYLDMTEDIYCTRSLKRQLECSEKKPLACFIPNNGVAPGLVSLMAKEAMQQLDNKVFIKHWKQVTLRVGALPMHTNTNPLQYASTWSLKGCVNQYINLCETRCGGLPTEIQPLSQYGLIRINGQEYEEFATSGGVGSLCDTLQYVPNIIYKTLRYPGHHKYMSFLLDDLKLRHYPEELVKILERALPTTDQDQVLIHVTVKGEASDGKLHDFSMTKTILPSVVGYMNLSAIEVATAASTLSVLELLFDQRIDRKGYIRVEDIPYSDFMKTKMAQTYLN